MNDYFIHHKFIERYNVTCELNNKSNEKRFVDKFYESGNLFYIPEGEDNLLYLDVLPNFKYKLSIPNYNIEAIIYVDNTETKYDYPSQITMTCGNKVLDFDKDKGLINVYNLDKEGKKNGIEFVYDLNSHNAGYGIAIKKIFNINGKRQDVKVVHSNKYYKMGIIYNVRMGQKYT